MLTTFKLETNIAFKKLALLNAYSKLGISACIKNMHTFIFPLKRANWHYCKADYIQHYSDAENTWRTIQNCLAGRNTATLTNDRSEDKDDCSDEGRAASGQVIISTPVVECFHWCTSLEALSIAQLKRLWTRIPYRQRQQQQQQHLHHWLIIFNHH